MAAVPRVAMPIGSADARMPLLDAVKGVACVLIVGHHLARYGPMADSASALAPSFFGWLAQHGRLAVQIFLVLAGFLAASSLAPDGVLRVDRRPERFMGPTVELDLLNLEQIGPEHAPVVGVGGGGVG